MKRARSRRVGYLWLPHLSIQTARLRHPPLRERPLIIHGGNEDGASSSGRVVDASAECCSAGVRLGMTAREAAELVSDALFLPFHPEAEAEVVGGALDLLERFSEVVEETATGAWFVPAGPLGGTLDERRLAASVVDGLAAALGLDARLAIAPGKHAARLICEHAGDPIEIVPEGQVASYLASWSIDLLPLSASAIHRLRLLGTTTIGDFVRLPSSALPRRFGSEALLAHHIARGEEDVPLVPRRRPEMVTLRRSFDPPIEDRDLVLRSAVDLLQRLCLNLRENGKAFRTLGLEVGLEDGRIVERRADLRQPTADEQRAHPLMRAIVETLALDLAVAHVTLHLGGITREEPTQHQFFADEVFGLKRAERRERVDRALGEIARRYRGRLRRVVPGEDPNSLLDDNRLLLLPYEPETTLPKLTSGESTSKAPSDFASASDFASERAGPAEPAVRSRPIRLVARGSRLYLMEGDPEENGLPITRDEIVALHARWEADDWWPAPARRTYYRVRTSGGVIATLARDHLRATWHLVERFD